MALSGTLLGLLKPGGTLLLSGLLNTQAAELTAHYRDRIELRVVGEREDWVCLRGTLS
ncbi:MAG: 50S ribosomal protein L11 methyltransferase [Haliea sp.]